MPSVSCNTGVVNTSPTGIFTSATQFSKAFCPISFNPEGSKQVRATCVTKLIRDGRVRLLKDAVWLKDFAKEVRAFPYGAHDDQIDALVQLLTEFEKGTLTSSSGVYIIDSCFGSYDNDIDDLYNELFDELCNEAAGCDLNDYNLYFCEKELSLWHHDKQGIYRKTV